MFEEKEKTFAKMELIGEKNIHSFSPRFGGGGYLKLLEYGKPTKAQTFTKTESIRNFLVSLKCLYKLLR